MAARKRVASGFAPFEPGLLQTDTVIDFDIYIWPDNSPLPVLYKNGNTPFLEEARAKLAEVDSNELYVKVEDEGNLADYVEAHLDRIMADPDLPLRDKAQALYHTSLALAEDILERPDAPENLRRSEDVVRNTIAYILQGREAFHQLLSLTSYDYYTYTHSVNVCTMGLALASETGVHSQGDLMEFGVGALFHDVGKTKISPAILRKRGPLTEDEWREMKRHPEIGLDMIGSQMNFPEGGKAIILEHHEWADGTGYPKGKKDGAIHAFAKIAAVVDVFDALTTRRAYRSAVGSFPALKVMKSECGTHFDGAVFEKFVRLLGT